MAEMADYSTQWLRDAAVAPALPGLMAGLVRQLRHVLQSGWPPMVRLTAIAEELDALAPPPPPLPDEGPAYGTEIARRLAASTSPATMLFSEMAGAPVRFAVWTSGCVRLSGSDADSLAARPGTWATERQGTFTLDGQVIADVSSTVIMDRLPSEAVASLETGTPLGAVLAATGHREPLSVQPWGGGIVSSARMWIGGERVALASEHVQPWFCRRTCPAAAA